MNDNLLCPNQLQNDVISHITAKAIMLMSQNNLYDYVEMGPVNIIRLAKKWGYHPKALLRLLRLLSSINIVEIIDEKFIQSTHLTPTLRKIKSEHFYGSYLAFSNFESSLKTNQQCWTETYGNSFYSYLNERPEKLSEFEDYVAITGDDWLQAVLDIHNFNQYSDIVDLGGGKGSFLKKVFEGNPNQIGILFEQESIISSLRQEDFSSQIKFCKGDFFNAIPHYKNAYVLCRILLNWSEEDSLKILNNCLKAMADHSQLIIVDFVIPHISHPHYHRALLHDLNLLAIFSSGIRTENEWESLVKQGGFKIKSLTIINESSNPLPNVPMLVLVCEKNL